MIFGRAWQEWVQIIGGAGVLIYVGTSLIVGGVRRDRRLRKIARAQHSQTKSRSQPDGDV